MICHRCLLPGDHNTDHDCRVAMEKAMLDLLKNIGDCSACSGCGAQVYWVHHRNGKRAPYTPAGLNHFVDCPKAGNFKR